MNRRLGYMAILMLVTCGCAQVPQQAPTPEPQPQPQPEVKQAEPAITPKQPSKEQLGAQIDRLVRQLGSEDYKERTGAQEELKTIADKKEGIVLARLLEKYKSAQDPEVKTGLEQVFPIRLYERHQITAGVVQEIPDILELLQEASYKSIRIAIERLRGVDFSESRQLLCWIVKNHKGLGRRRAVEALVDNADDAVNKFFISMLSLGVEKPNENQAALLNLAEYALKKIGNKALSAVKEAFKTEQDYLVLKRMACILACVGQQGTETLLKVAKEGDCAHCAASLAAVLEETRLVPPLEVLLKAIEDESVEGRVAAARLLLAHRDEIARKTLKKALKEDVDARVRESAVFVLAMLEGEDVVPVLVGALKDADPDVRNCAASALAFQQDKRAIKPMIEALDTLDPTAAESFFCFGKKAIPELLKAYEKMPDDVRANLLPIIRTYCADRDTVISLALKALKSEEYSLRWSGAIVLGELGNQKHVDAIAKLLGDSQMNTANAAARALGKIGGEKAYNTLLETLEQGDSYAATTAADCLVQIAGQRAFAALAKLAENDRRTYPDALALSGGKKAIPHVVNLLKDPLEFSAAYAVTRFGEEAVEPLLEILKPARLPEMEQVLWALVALREKRAIETLLGALKHEESQVRMKAAMQISLFRDPRIVEPLAALLKDEDHHVREVAAIALRHVGDKKTVVPLVEVVLDDEFDSVRCEAVKTLGEIGDKRAIEALVSALDSDGAWARVAAAQALGVFKDPRAVDALVETVADENANVACAAACALTKIGDKCAIEPLIEKCRNPGILRYGGPVEPLLKLDRKVAVDVYLSVMTDKAGAVRRDVSCGLGSSLKILVEQRTFVVAERNEHAAMAVGELGDKRAIKPLKAALKSRSTKLRMCAAVGLAHLGAPEGEAILKSALRNKQGNEREIALWALGFSTPPALLEELIAALKEEGPETRYFIPHALMRIGGERAVDTVVAALKDKDQWTRQEAAKVLGRKKKECSIGPLIEIMANDPEHHVREKAHDALHEITGQNFGWNWQAWQRWYGQKQRSREGKEE